MSRDPERIERPGPSPEALLALVVEDSAELRVTVANTLAAHYRVIVVSRAANALQLAQELAPAVIVAAAHLPDGDGYALCRALRAIPRTRMTPIVLITERHEATGTVDAFDAGADDSVVKPVHERELLARVDMQVSSRRVVQELAISERHALLGVMAASIAHQVRNPLTTLVAGLPAMRARVSGSLDKQTTELLEVMVDCAERIERLTRDLMDISRVDREPSGAFDPADGLRSAVRLAKARVIGDATIEDDVRDGVTIEGRPGDINHVFLNLIDNAIRAVDDGGRVRIAAHVTAGYYTVDIGDSGAGVDPRVAQRIFEPFFTTRPAGEGTGLGLAIAMQIVRAHGGDISVGRSELGGALFTVRLPLDLARDSVSLAS